MKGRRVQPGTAKFVAIAAVLMVIMDQFMFGGSRPYIEKAREEYAAKMEEAKPAPVVVQPEEGEFFEAPVAIPVPDKLPLPKGEGRGEGLESPPDVDHRTPSPKPSPLGRGPVIHGAPKVAIIIDDLGMDIRRSRQVLDLPAPMTLAFLPYADKTPELAGTGKKKGHSLIIHTPMEAMDGKQNIGPGGLKVAMSDAEFDKAFGVMLSSFEGYEGINNHMGSRLTADDAKMKRLMGILRQKNLFFVDSKTNPASVAAGQAQMAGIPFAERDVFIDHVETLDFARRALRHTEQLALRRGYAIAIGHPKDHTIAALKEWLPTLKAKGIELVPVKALLVKPEGTAVAHEKSSPQRGEDLGEGAVVVQTVEHRDPLTPALSPEGRGGDMPMPPDMFPPTAVAPASGGPGIELHPLPEQSRGLSSPIH